MRARRRLPARAFRRRAPRSTVPVMGRKGKKTEPGMERPEAAQMVSDLLGRLLKETQPPTAETEKLVRTIVVTSLQLAASAFGNADDQRTAAPTAAEAEVGRGYL